MRLRIIAHVASVTTYYHVTPHSRTPKILKEGLVTGKPRMWKNQLGKSIGEKNRIYLFSDLDSAIQFAFRYQWDTKKPADILRIEVDIPDLETDPHVESQMNGGKWKMTSQSIPPDKIKEVIPLTQEMVRDFIKRRDG
jgi:hypothetical protein